MTLVFVVIHNRLFKPVLFLGTPLLAFPLRFVPLYLSQHIGGLLTTHYRDAGIGPHKQKAGIIGATAHTVVAGTKGAADQNSKLGYLGCGHCGDHLGAMFGNTAVFVLLAHHKAGDILQKYQGDFALGAQLHKVRSLLRGLAKQDAVVGDNAHRVAMDSGKATDQGGAVEGFKLVEVRAIDNPCNHFAHIVGDPGFPGDNAVDLAAVVEGFLNLCNIAVNGFDPV